MDHVALVSLPQDLPRPCPTWVNIVCLAFEENGRSYDLRVSKIQDLDKDVVFLRVFARDDMAARAANSLEKVIRSLHQQSSEDVNPDITATHMRLFATRQATKEDRDRVRDSFSALFGIALAGLLPIRRS